MVRALEKEVFLVSTHAPGCVFRDCVAQGLRWGRGGVEIVRSGSRRETTSDGRERAATPRLENEGVRCTHR